MLCSELNKSRKPIYNDKNLQQSDDEDEDEIENSSILLEEPEVIEIITVSFVIKISLYAL